MYRHPFDTMFRLRTRAMRFAPVSPVTRLRLWLRRGPALITGVAAAAALLIAACGGAHPAEPSSPLGAIDRATKTVQLNLIIRGSEFNGYPGGQMTVRVPRGWRVDVFCSNQGSTPQSCAVVSGSQSTDPAFRGSACPRAAAGVPSGRFVNFSFTVTREGSYRITSLAAGRGHGGMWGRFEVIPAGSPSVST